MRKIFKHLIRPEEAAKICMEYLKSNRIVEVDLIESLGKVSAENIFSEIDVPMFTRADLDGYAVRCSDVINASEQSPAMLKVIGRIGPNEVFQGIINEKECVEVATGSPLPIGADAIVPVEYVEEENGRIRVFRKVGFFENVLTAGTDFQVGDLVLGEGEIINESKIASLSSIGKKSIKVFDNLTIGIIPTGNEIVPPGEELQFGQIFDVNSYLLSSYCKRLGFKVELYKIVKDDIREIESAVNELLDRVDVILISGGSSVGVRDLVYRIYEKQDSKLIFHGVMVRPGKPLGFGIVKGKPVFCLPGNPLSSIVSLMNIILGQILKQKEPDIVRARLVKRYFPSKGRTEIVPSILIRTNNNYLVYPLSGSSGSISRIASSDGYFIVPSPTEILEEQTVVDFIKWFGEKSTNIIVFGEIDGVVRTFFHSLSKELGIKVRYVKAGREEAIRESTKIPSALSIKHKQDDQIKVKGTREILLYHKRFGIYSKQFMKDRRPKALSWPPNTIESVYQSYSRLKPQIVGYISSSYEAKKYVDEQLVDMAFMYKLPNDGYFEEIGQICVSVLLPEKFVLENTKVIERALDLTKKIIKSNPVLKEMILFP